VSAGKDLTFARNGETLRGHLAVPYAPAESPAILLIPDVHGLSDLYLEIAGRFAARGFATLAVDLYTRYERRSATSRGARSTRPSISPVPISAFSARTMR
jgi:dienelactone hydrolase